MWGVPTQNPEEPIFLLRAQLFGLLGLFFLSFQPQHEGLLCHHVSLTNQLILGLFILLELGSFASEQVLVLHCIEVIGTDLQRLVERF